MLCIVSRRPTAVFYKNMAMPKYRKESSMNYSKFSKLLAAVTSLTILGGMLPAYQPGAILTARAEEVPAIGESEAPADSGTPEIEAVRAVRSSSIRFDLNGGSLNDEKFTVTDGVAVLADENVHADAPEPEAPALSGLVFAGWTNASGSVITTFENDTTYYAAWNYSSMQMTNPNSGLVNYFNHGNYYDFRGNNGNLKTTYSDNGYNISYKVNGIEYGIGKNGLNATHIINSGLALTPVFSFCDCFGNVSENPEENLYTKVTYFIQNRSDADIDSFGLASTADVQIGRNDCAPIYAYSDDDTQLSYENCANYNVKNVEMRDNDGNIFLLSIPEDAKCWWGITVREVPTPTTIIPIPITTSAMTPVSRIRGAACASRQARLSRRALSLQSVISTSSRHTPSMQTASATAEAAARSQWIIRMKPRCSSRSRRALRKTATPDTRSGTLVSSCGCLRKSTAARSQTM